jgi:PTH1 family peptidyl-tRNA hydrolase
VKLIVGLGNPGPQYAGTRHNVGFDVVDLLAGRFHLDLRSERFHAWFGVGRLDDEPLALMKPTTYMNRSGEALWAAGRFYKLGLEDFLVLCDDMALPLGRLRIRAGGSSGLHKGLQSIIDRLGTEDWARLRIGIGDPVGDPSAYVLSRFDEEEEKVMGPARQRAADAAEWWLRHGVQSAMNRFNVGPKGE